MAQEILVNNPAIGNLIREGKTAQLYSQIQTGANQGMQTLERALANLVIAGTVIVAVPIALILLVFQRQLIRGLTAGAVKG